MKNRLYPFFFIYLILKEINNVYIYIIFKYITQGNWKKKKGNTIKLKKKYIKY